MNRNLAWKIILTLVLVLVAVWTLYPPNKTLKPGIDLAGGTSLIYEIDTQDLNQSEKQDLAQNMITVLRRRIDPANIQNLIWRPQGNTRFEIQMPLASAEARQKRQAYEEALQDLLDENVNRALVLRWLNEPEDKRSAKFQELARSDPNRLEILENLADVYDRRQQSQLERDTLVEKLRETEAEISSAGLDVDQIRRNRVAWAKLDDAELQARIEEVADANETVKILNDYVETFSQWSDVMDTLTRPDEGLNDKFEEARRALNRLNLTADQMRLALEMAEGSSRRKEALEELKENFPNRVDQIERVVATYDAYRPFRGRLDDPKDLQRMLKGAGILEFRILPTYGQGELDADQIDAYIQALQEKGPTYASDNDYVWKEVEDPQQWRARDESGNPTILAQFGEKTYVLASNKPEESLLQGAGSRKWKLQNAKPTSDSMGRRAIGFMLDERGKKPFADVTGDNIGRPLCILLDDVAISAPNVESRILGDGIITGSFTQTEVQDMVNKLNAGSLPARLIEQPISVNTIGPSIGADNRNQGIRAGFIGLVVVMVVMLGYYLFAGAIADVALVLNILFVLAIMATVRATFTLPGIAGIILTIGMSVDANVLIFERIREEQKKGSSLRIAIGNGYQRAFRTIFDANLTTFITAAILYWVASEEIKGFAIVLMLGIASSMFTALFVTRIVFDWLLSRRLIKDRLAMLTLIHNPTVDWMRLRPVFMTISAVLIAGGLFVFFTRDNEKNNKYDIEFTGGTNVQINLKQDVELTRQQVEDQIQQVGLEVNNPALAAANVYSVGEPYAEKEGENLYRQYEINTTETNETRATITLAEGTQMAATDVAAKIRDTLDKGRFGGRLSGLRVEQDPNNASAFMISTSQMNRSLVRDVIETAFPDAEISELRVDEVVNNAIVSAFGDKLEIQQDLEPNVAATERITEKIIEDYPELSDYLGGVRIVTELGRDTTVAELEKRFSDLRFKPESRDLTWYDYTLLDPQLDPLTDPNAQIDAFAYVSVDPEAGARELSEEEWTRFTENEKSKILSATQMETSLPRVRQFDPSIGAEAKTRALIAIVLSLFAIVTYVWVRFGNVRYGVAAIVALVHDVAITLGAVAACTYIANKGIGELLLIGDFKINLAMIAAFLTLIGYSLNDTIVVFDRIRENRGKGKLINANIINDSVNQTVSRTIMTSFTTFVVVLVMYIFGGQNIRGFTFAIGLGVLIGTYSSIAIAAPILLIGEKAITKAQKKMKKSK